MKTLLLGINSKYIHPNMAIRLLKAIVNMKWILKNSTLKTQLKKYLNL